MAYQSKVIALSDDWKIIYDKDNAGKEQKWYKKGIPSKGAVSAYVPSYVHLFFPAEESRGVSWYEKVFTEIPKAGENELYILKFAMAVWHTEVYLNGEFVGEHNGCEDPFEFDVTKYIKFGEKNRLDVRVSKPHSEPVDGFSFYEIPHRNETPTGLRPGSCHNSYGIHGAVELCVVPKLYMLDQYLHANPETGDIEIKFTVRNSYGKSVKAKLSSEVSNKRTGEYIVSDEYTANFKKGDTVVTRNIHIEDFLLWDIDDPNLYNVSMTLDSKDVSHKLIKHCGFRTFTVNEKDGYFYLNGRRVLMKCSHTGNCMPESFQNISRKKELLRKDFSMAKACGFNMVRFISGVALPEQLDYCDELGLMIYEEPLGGWLLYDSDRAEELLKHDLLQMIYRDRSHPCVTIFGFLNETTTRAPYGKCYYYARNFLKAARELDDTRLFLYSSGRFDAKYVSGDECDPWCGSFANPHHDEWQCLWNEDSEKPMYWEKKREKDGVGDAFKAPGDIHEYPRVPIPADRAHYLRTLGSYSKKAVLISETGIGSMFNVMWLCKKFDEMKADEKAPDVKTVRKMKEDFLNDLKAFGFDKEWPFPEDILYESEVMHNIYRKQLFDIFRSNPYLNGMSLTGLLDHSICGEGFFTFMREFKPMIADTLQNGFSPVRWCLFMNRPNHYRGNPIELEAVIANEGVLDIGKYPVSIKIVDKDRNTLFEDHTVLEITKTNKKLMSVPVYKKTIEIDLPEGEYTFRADLEEGAGATDGRMRFFVLDKANTKAKAKTVVTAFAGDNVKALLAENGIKEKPLGKAKAGDTIILGEVPAEEREALWNKIYPLLNSGCKVIAASRYSLFKVDENLAVTDTCGYLPATEKPVSHPLEKRNVDWLYHKEYLLKKNDPYFEGLPTGMMRPDYYNEVMSSHCFVYEQCPKLPEEIHAACFGTGMPWGFIDRSVNKNNGINLATYYVGNGRLTVNSFDIVEFVGQNPAADRLLINIINSEYGK